MIYLYDPRLNEDCLVWKEEPNAEILCVNKIQQGKPIPGELNTYSIFIEHEMNKFMLARYYKNKKHD